MCGYLEHKASANIENCRPVDNGGRRLGYDNAVTEHTSTTYASTPAAGIIGGHL